tara:strand:+ start:503 stop:1237 length:735 start_codon:yes stop_codon:yes gene_type:complete
MSINGTKILALNSTADGYVPIKVDSSGRLEVNNVENEATLTAIVGYVDEIESKLDTLNTSTVANIPFNPNTPSTYTNSRLGTILTQQIDGTQRTACWGADDILGNTPRSLTVDGNGRLMTYPYEHPSSWTNTHLQSIITNQSIRRTDGNLLNVETLTSLELYATKIDCSSHSRLRVIGTAQSAFNIYGSIDDITYYLIYTIYPETNINHLGHFNYKFEHPPKYIKIKNGAGSTNTITLDYDLTH